MTSLVPVKDIYRKISDEMDYMKWIISIYCEQVEGYNSSVDFKGVISSLLLSDNPSESFINIVMVKTILSFLELSNGKFEQAYKGLSWVSNFIKIFESSYCKAPEDKALSIDLKNSITLLFAKSSLVYDGVTLLDLDFQTSRILHCSLRFNIPQERLNGKLESFFLTMGFLLQKRAVLSSEIIAPGKIKLNQNDLEEMVRNFIVLSTLLPVDDCNITRVYDDLLTAILFHGSLHIKVLWCFKFLRDYLTLQVHLSSPFICDYVSEFSGFHRVNSYSKLIIKSIMKIEKLVGKSEMQTALIEDRFGSSFLIPEIIATVENNQLVKMVFSEKCERVLEDDEIKKLQTKSDELIKLWFDSFRDYKGEPAEEVYKYFKKMRIIE